MPDEPEARSTSELDSRVLQLERQIRRLTTAVVVLGILVALLLLVDRNWIKSAEVLVGIVIIASAIVIVPLIVFGGVRFLERWTTKE